MTHATHDPGKRLTMVWAATVVLTLAAAAASTVFGGSTDDPRRLVAFAVLGLGAVKSRLILREFMEIREAPRWLRWLSDFWLLATFVIVIGFYEG